ncbi:hypothetical protein DSL92_09035 [Billgrantia gudaonensis]|uniref:Uncharacterized protein n=1 Tax=Billgrantia gudaonensis TaxID=376427 RepID=A0A3S0Q0N2_9GAMM|nr:hypothetical protein DSL92_09035 [Halomonas gudaonensis]
MTIDTFTVTSADSGSAPSWRARGAECHQRRRHGHRAGWLRADLQRRCGHRRQLERRPGR